MYSPFQNWPLRVKKTWPWGCHFVPGSVYQWHRTRLACVAKVPSPSGAKLFCASLANRQGNIAASWRVQIESKKLLLLFLYKCCQYLNKNHNFLLGNELRKVPCMDNIYTCIYKYCAYLYNSRIFLLQIWAFQGATMQKSNNKNRRKYANTPSSCSFLVVLSIIFSWCLQFGSRLITVEAIFHVCPENQMVIIRREEWTWVRVISMEIWRGAILV